MFEYMCSTIRKDGALHLALALSLLFIVFDKVSSRCSPLEREHTAGDGLVWVDDSATGAALAFSARSPFTLKATRARGDLSPVSIPSHSPFTDIPFWSAEIVQQQREGILSINPLSPTRKAGYTKECGNSVFFYWIGIQVGDEGNHTVNVNVTIDAIEGLFHVAIGFTMNSDALSVWSYTVQFQVPFILEGKHTLLQNRGFGVLHDCNDHFKSQGAESAHDAENIKEVELISAAIERDMTLDNVCHRGFSLDYPQGTFQFLAAYVPNQPFSGFYFATHDGKGYSKTFAFNGINREGSDGALPDGVYPGVMSVTTQPLGAGQSEKYFLSPYDVVISFFDGNWWDASQIYREWAINQADWVRKGPIALRVDTPMWLQNLTVWVNSHWQALDIFNITGGDGEVLSSRMADIVNLLADPAEGVGLHWYEWDALGYDPSSNYTDCLAYPDYPDQNTCGFDTHYPEYDTVRDGFDAAREKMQQLGIRVVPYINGRIFDTATETWQKENGFACASKSAPPVASASPALSTYNESYGSHAVFAVSCPYTSYWQSKISDTTETLVKTHGVDGVYLDQIAAAGPKNCFDGSHGHTIGGGDYWVRGYSTMLDECRSAVGNEKALLTESNSEPFMDGINMYLTLVGFSGNYAGPSRVVNVFASVYGGYYLAMGAMFFRRDLDQTPNVFAAKVAQQYVFGAQLGWFSLGGRDNQVPYMGMYEAMMDSRHAPEISYLKELMSAKRSLRNWLQNGQAMREVPLEMDGITKISTAPQTVVASSIPISFQDPYNALDHWYTLQSIGTPHAETYSQEASLPKIPSYLVYPLIASSAWLAPSQDSLLITFTSIRSDTSFKNVSFTIDVMDYGLEYAPGSSCSVSQAYPQPPEPKVPLKQACVSVSWATPMKPREVYGVVIKQY